MADLEDVLNRSFNAPPVPSSGRALVDYAGGRRAATELVSGLDHPPRRGEYRSDAAFDADRRKWNNAARSAQRWSTEAGQRRASPKVTPAQKAKFRREANRRKREEGGRRGMNARLKARIIIHSPGVGKRDDSRVRVLPSINTPPVFIPASTVEEILDELGDGDAGEAAQSFLGAFLEIYGLDPDVDLGDVHWLKLWPTGTPEPAGE